MRLLNQSWCCLCQRHRGKERWRKLLSLLRKGPWLGFIPLKEIPLMVLLSVLLLSVTSHHLDQNQPTKKNPQGQNRVLHVTKTMQGGWPPRNASGAPTASPDQRDAGLGQQQWAYTPLLLLERNREWRECWWTGSLQLLKDHTGRLWRWMRQSSLAFSGAGCLATVG